MKRTLLIGLTLSALALPCFADGEIEITFNSSKPILPSSHWTSRELWQADVWIVNTGKNLAPNESSTNYNNIWGTPSDDSNGKHWYENDYTLTSGKPYSSDLFDSTGVIEWTTKNSPFNTDKWINVDVAGDIYIRRQFTLTEIPEGPIYLACGRDDAPSEWYINGALVHSENHGWDEGAVVLLTDEEKANLRVGENLMAVHVHQNWGGAYADCGLYGSDQKLYLLSKGGDGASWPSVYKLLDENSQIAGEVNNGCFAVGADESDWTTAMGPFSNSNDKWRTTYWDSDNHPILIRRHFTLNNNNLKALKANGNIYLMCSYDEYPVVYLNGTKIWSATGWNDNNYATYKLSDDDKKLLRQGDNVLAISAQRGTGGGHVEYALNIEYPCVGFKYVADLTLLQSTLENLISSAKDLIETPLITNAITAAEASLETAETEEELQEAINAINQAITTVKDATTDIETYYAILALNYTNADAAEIFENAQTRDDYAKALRVLRYARRYEAADKHEDVFSGHTPEEGDFYLYNVGRKQFLCGGCEWGAHAALGFPGVLLTLEGSGNSYVIETGLYNADSEHYLGYNCYMDTSAKDKWTFTDAGNGCCTIRNGNDYLAWDAINVSGGNNDETYVGLTNEFSPNALWKLVTKEDRDNLLADASENNPVDATYFIKSPNFSNREFADRHWLFTNSQIFEYGGNHNDFAAESWNTASFDIHQTIEGLPEGIYELSVQAFYRNGEGSQMVNNDDAKLAVLYAGDSNLGTYQELEVMNINEESHKAPGEGTVFVGNSRTVHVPDNVPQAANFFKSGLYKHSIKLTLTNPNNDRQSTTRAVSKVTKASLPIGLKQTQSGNEKDWAVMNNVRLKYLGTPYDPTTGVEDLFDTDSEVLRDNKTYNLFGIEVKNPTAPGIYIRNGKKFIIR